MRVLFVCGSYYKKPSANGVCVLRLRESLKAMGISSDVVSQECIEKPIDDAYGTNYFAGTDKEGAKKGTVLFYIQRFWHFLTWPIKSPGDCIRYYKAIKTACKDHSYDAIISVLRPINGCIAASRFDHFILYELDSITNNTANERGVQKHLKHRTVMIERLLYKRAKAIIHLNCHAKFYHQDQYQKYQSKTHFSDIPQLIEPPDQGGSADRQDSCNLIYTGILNSYTRSPKYVMDLVKRLSTTQPGIHLDFYSKGDCEDMIASEERETGGIICGNGYVALSYLEKKMEESDFLVSIGNKFQGTVTSIPSKVISYIATGKPIIHMYGGRNDTAVGYLNQYGNAIIIDPDEEFEKNVDLLSKFISKNKGNRIPFEQVAPLFPMNTPDYTAKMIMGIAQSK